MIFSELYSAYYNAVARILARLTEGDATERELQKIVAESAFGESVLAILPALKGERWQLMRPNMTTAIENKPTMPLTLLEKQWLKAISLDPRVKLFGVEFPDLDGIEPLFTPDDYRIYDRYGDGDPYTDEGYIKRFRVILNAMREGLSIKLEMLNRKDNTVFVRCRPARLEYSEKDDKFRLVTKGCRFITTVNLSRVTACSIYQGERQISDRERPIEHNTVTLKIRDERNALERVMLHFAHFEKQTEKLARGLYLVRIKYDRDDEPEMVIRILSFGPLVEVIEPDSFRALIIDRLKRQRSLGLR